jgi:S1-C subfamily serine protease
MKFEDPGVHKRQELRRKQANVDDTQFKKWGFKRWDVTGSPERPANRFVRNLIIFFIATLIATVFIGERLNKKDQSPRVGPDPSGSNAFVPSNVEMPSEQGSHSGSTVPEHVFRVASPAVVVVDVFDGNGNQIGQGSGVVVNRDYVITNRHVVERGRTIRVRQSGRSFGARVRYTDSQFDLCGLDVSGLPATPVAIGSVKSIAVGQRVYAIGAPRGLELSISEGLVSSLRPIAGSLNIQTTAAMSPGSSGGGLFDHNGFLVGITTFVVKDGQNLNFALPADLIHGLPARSADMNSPQPIASPTIAQSPAPRSEATNRKVILEDMGNVVEIESVKYGFRSQSSFSAYNGYIIINPVDLDKYPMEKSIEVVKSFISRIGRMIYEKGLVDEEYKLFVQIHGVEYVTNVHKCRQGQWNLLEKAHK